MKTNFTIQEMMVMRDAVSDYLNQYEWTNAEIDRMQVILHLLTDEITDAVRANHKVVFVRQKKHQVPATERKHTN